jgi:hypothetical protein
VLAWSILNIFLPGIRYVPGTEYNPMDIVIGFLYDTFRHGYLGNALVILLGAVLIGFGRENKGTYGKALIFTGFFLVCGYLISSMNNGYYRSLIWTGSQDAAPYLETIFPSWSFAGNVLSQTPMIFLLYIGFKERQYPLLISGALSLSISIVFMLLNRSLPLFLQVSSSLVLFTLSLIVLHFMGKRREGADSEMI